MRHPDEIMKDLEVALEGSSFSPHELIWEIIEDILHSVKLADAPSPDHNVGSPVYDTVVDYVTNHYGELGQ